MNSNQKLQQIIHDFERDLPKTTKHKREALAHQIDDFLLCQNPSQTPEIYLEEVRTALSKCNLPLTRCIFEQETSLKIQDPSKSPLEISPSVSITVVPVIQKTHSQCTQTDTCFEKTNTSVSKTIESLQSIKTEVTEILKKYEKHKHNRKHFHY